MSLSTVSRNYFTLATTGAKLPTPAFGVGTKLSNLKRSKSDYGEDALDQTVAEAVAQALRLGFVHIDTAEIYKTHAEVAEGIRLAGIDRSKIWITDKYNPGYATATSKQPATSKTAYEAIQTALKDMKLEYIDLYLIHSQFFSEELSHGNTIEQAWGDLEKAMSQGLVKNIGLSNFDGDHLKKVLRVANIKPQVLQIEFNPYLFNQTPGIVKFAKDNNILVEAYSPLTPLFRATDGPLDPVLTQLSEKYSKTKAQILLRWTYQNGVSPITTSSNGERIRQALEAFDESFQLSDEDVELITNTGSEFKYRGFFPAFDNSNPA